MNTLYRLTGWRIFAPSRMPWGESTDQWSEVDWSWFHKQPRVTFEPVAVDWVVGTPGGWDVRGCCDDVSMGGGVMFHVGQRVECIEDGIGPRGYEPEQGYPVIGAVYTIAAVGITQHGAVGINLIEHPHSHPTGWRASRFRPIVERKTDISIFTAMLTPNKVNA